MSLFTQIRDSVVNATTTQAQRDEFNKAADSGNLAGYATAQALDAAPTAIAMATREPSGNLNAADIAAGKSGDAHPTSTIAGLSSASVAGFSLPVVIIGAVILMLALGRKSA